MFYSEVDGFDQCVSEMNKGQQCAQHSVFKDLSSNQSKNVQPLFYIFVSWIFYFVVICSVLRLNEQFSRITTYYRKKKVPLPWV